MNGVVTDVTFTASKSGAGVAFDLDDTDSDLAGDTGETGRSDFEFDPTLP